MKESIAQPAEGPRSGTLATQLEGPCPSSGDTFDAAGLAGMFATLAGLFVILAIAVQFPPETFAKPLEEDPAEPGAIHGH